MRFITFGYLLFFVVIFLIYWQIRDKQKKLIFLALASSIFYASWSLVFFIHLAILILINYIFSLKIRSHQTTKGIYLKTILGIDMMNLIIFKYFYLIIKFLYDITNYELFHRDYINNFIQQYFYQESIILPLAISFYTFQMIAYLVDCYYNKIQRKDSLIEFYVFILFFPQLVAGPIMRHSDFFYQLDQKITLREDYVIKGFYHLFTGLIKKVIIADNLAIFIEPVFQNPQEYSGLTNFLAAVGYAIRIYGDFSGYTDIARGSAYLLGFKIPENFDGPFLSTSISEFWRRWHVTLSSWLRDYIYVPLGGNRISQLRTSLNLVLTFTIGGLWHGANYNFIVWGFFYGVLLVIEKPYLEKFKVLMAYNKIFQYLFIAYSFLLFSLGLCFFNAPDITNSFMMLKQIIFFSDGNFFNKDQLIQLVGFLVLTFFFNWIQYKKKDLNVHLKRDFWILYLLGILLVWVLGNYAPQTQRFIYFQF